MNENEMLLIIDDDNAVMMSMSFALKRAGFDCLTASNEKDALQAVRNPEVELAVLDMNLTLSTTGQQGLEMLRKMKILRPEMPVILISAWGTIPLAVKGVNLGAADFMTKPWSNLDLIEKIKKALADAAAEQQEREHVIPLDAVERDAVVKAIRMSDGNLSDAAAKLGITRQALYRRIQKYGL